MGQYTPMMEQYLAIKENYKYCLLFYRLGDFYELFFDDALIASRELELTLTGKDCGMEERAPMCGVPFHSADGYIARLIDKGYKVAVCEQTEDPKKASGIVKREVIRIVTPGTVLDTNVLDEGKNNYIMSLFKNIDGYGVATCDVSTGELQVMSLAADRGSSVIDEIARFMPSELIANEGFDLSERIKQVFDLRVQVQEERSFSYQNAYICLCSHFSTLNLEGFGIENDRPCVCAGGALMRYLLDTQKNELSHISSIKKYSIGRFMILDVSSRRNLELIETMRDKSKKGSLLWVLDRTKTAMGARLLRSCVERPLTDIDKIHRRLDCVEVLKNSVMERDELREALDGIYDIERLMGRIVYGSANARDLTALKASLAALPSLKQIIGGFDCELLRELYSQLDTMDDICALISESIAEDPPFSIREGGLIREGYSAEVDKLREAEQKGSDWLRDLENREKEATGIPKLRIKYNKVFGYYIEVTNSYKNMVPERYTRKQTLTNCERYITEELKEIEDTILGAQDKAVALEYELFTQIRSRVAQEVERIQRAAYIVSVADMMQSLADVADRSGYCKPEVDESGIIDIRAGRHPVVEKISKEPFIPNDTLIDKSERTVIITGPNMAGKSTYMRQCALIVLMAQVGSFVPAELAHIGITDRIFTRVGASDDLATGQSTFMVEMVEVANILNNATENSLLILDEIGRGTSTFDGLSIAWAVLEHIAKKIKARTLFATHYHELTELEGKLDGVCNYCVSVKEQGEDIIFLRKIIRGGTDRSYGVHVAKLAGVPKSVVKRANKILSALGTKAPIDGEQIMSAAEEEEQPQSKEESLFKELKQGLDAMDIDNMTPIEAMKRLYEIRELVNSL